MIGPFEQTDVEALIALIGAYPLAWIVSNDGEAFASTPLPLLAERNGTGFDLFGHFAARNPQVSNLRADPRAIALFMGPNAYVAPRHVSKPRWAPTWNYAVVQVEGDVQFLPEENVAAVEALAAHLEQGRDAPWRAERLGPRLDALIGGVCAFRIRARRIEAAFKLGQDEDPTTRAEIIAAFADTPLGRMMEDHDG